MKQKKESDAFKNREEVKFRSDYDYTAPAESLEHILRVNDFQKNLVKQDNNHRLEAASDKKKYLAQQKSADRA